MTPKELAYIVELEDQIKQQVAVIDQLREALEESNALNVNWSSDAEPETLAYYSEYREVIAIGTKALTLQPCPEVLNRVRADAVREASKLAAVSRSASDAVFMIDNYAQRIEKGEA